MQVMLEEPKSGCVRKQTNLPLPSFLLDQADQMECQACNYHLLECILSWKIMVFFDRIITDLNLYELVFIGGL